MQTKCFGLMKKINVDFLKIVCGLGKTDVWLSFWTQLSSFTTISNSGALNHDVSSAYEPNWLKSIGKFSFKKWFLGRFMLGVGNPKPCKTLSFKYLLMFKKN